MLQTENPANRFMNLHLEFVEECTKINNDMKALYAKPYQFISENSTAIDQFMAEAKVPGAPEDFSRSLHGVRDFVHQLEDFKQQTMLLFFEHSAYTDKCSVYLKKSQELRAKYNSDSSNCPESAEKLLQELTSLRFGLNSIREKAGVMTNQLRKIEGKWTVITTSK